MHRYEEDRWSVPCRDGSGRLRELVVFVTDAADVAMLAPPGEAAVIGLADVGAAKDALTEAQIRAVARRQSR
ncbi:hypothetical protein [Actinokineospora sp.]|uniref:hypothetical protein n=1 Tax=Actinokineospora sp. TaxID=1872133 RepID=UPI00403786CD